MALNQLVEFSGMFLTLKLQPVLEVEARLSQELFSLRERCVLVSSVWSRICTVLYVSPAFPVEWHCLLIQQLHIHFLPPIQLHLRFLMALNRLIELAELKL